jgi:hypothetical protein
MAFGADTSELLIAHDGLREDKKVVFNDMLVSERLLLLATSEGVYRVDRAAGRAEKIELARDDAYSVIQLYAVSKTGREEDFDLKGNVYVIARSHSVRETSIYRLCVDSAGSDNRIALVHEYPHNKKRSSYWIRYAAPQQCCIIDGITIYNYCSRIAQHAPHVSFMSVPRLHNKSIYRGQETNQLPLGIQDAHAIRAMVRNSITGSWLVAGDFGLRVNK